MIARCCEGSRCHRDPNQVKDDPQSPGVGVRKMSAASKTKSETRDQRNNSERHKQQHDGVKRRKQLMFQGFEIYVYVVVGRPKTRTRLAPAKDILRLNRVYAPASKAPTAMTAGGTA